MDNTERLRFVRDSITLAVYDLGKVTAELGSARNKALADAQYHLALADKALKRAEAR